MQYLSNNIKILRNLSLFILDPKTSYFNKIINPFKKKNIKVINPYKFTNLIWTFDLNNAQEFINQVLRNYISDSKIHYGLENFLKHLFLYFDSTNQINSKNYIVKIYSSVILENGSIIRATENFYEKAWYSNVAVAMDSEELFEYLSDQGNCYGKVFYIYKLI